MKNKGLFRQVALGRLSSPDELDRLLQVTTANAWIALAGMCLLVVSVVLWSIFGRLPTRLEGNQCILVKNGGVNVVTTAASGRISDLAVAVGDVVTRGQIIGRLQQTDLLDKIKSQEARLKDLEAQYERALEMTQRGAKLRDASTLQQAQALQTQLETAKVKVKLVADRIQSQTELYQQGLITKQTLILSQMDEAAAEQDVENVKSQIQQLEFNDLQGKKQSDADIAVIKNQLDDLRHQVTQSYRETRDATSIISPYGGRVVEIKAAEGQFLERAAAVATIVSTSDDVNELEAFLYLPASEGKKVKSGMKVDVSPSTAKREEFGFLPAYVASVADYPSTDQGLMHVFGNEKLVKELSGEQAPIQIVASLTPSANNASHYQWSTREGPSFEIQSGTACSASITLASQRPISLVIPILKRWLGAS